MTDLTEPSIVQITSSKLSVSLSCDGARIVGVEREGLELALAYQDAADYHTDDFFLGATVGPIANRIAHGQLNVGGQLYQLPLNDGQHSLHSGGRLGFDKRRWVLAQADNDTAVFELHYDLSQIGLHGLLMVKAQYTVERDSLRVEYRAHCDQPTFVNLTNHVYWNLSGVDEQGLPANINDHRFRLLGRHYLNNTDCWLPDGSHTLWDDETINQMDRDGVFATLGSFANHYFCLEDSDELKQVATIVSLSSGVEMTVHSTAPGYLFYSGVALAAPFSPSSGFCIETQYAPDAINQPQLYAPLLEPGDEYRQWTQFCFADSNLCQSQ